MYTVSHERMTQHMIASINHLIAHPCVCTTMNSCADNEWVWVWVWDCWGGNGTMLVRMSS